MRNFHFYLNKLTRFFRSPDFSKAVILSLAISLPIFIFSLLGSFEVGVALAIGCLLSSPSDIPGSFRHKVIGVALAAILAGMVSLVTGYASGNIFILLPLIALLMFGISYLAVFGFRASLVAFSGLFAIVLSFANLSVVLDTWERALLITLGGFWYLGLSVLWYYLNPKRPTEQLLAGAMELTALFLKTRARLLTETNNREELQNELFQLQGELNEKHESLRDILIRSRLSFGNSNFARKRLLIFIELVDILELAIANPVDYKKLDLLVKNNPVYLTRFKKLIEKLASQLEDLALAIEKNKRFSREEIQDYLEKVESGFISFRESLDFKKMEKEMFLLEFLFEYLEKQAQKINTITRNLYDLENEKQVFPRRKEVEKFITPQDYDPKILVENFTFKSIIFRHSVRLAVVVLVGFSVGAYFSLDNAYWILLTIVVIMRPNYGLTKQRSQQRTVGTIIGGVIAFGIVFFIKDPVVHGILGLFSLTLAFSLIQKNYRTAAVFVTLSIVFIYSLLEPNVYEVIQYRIIDTLLGAGLAFLGNLWLWPSWEVKNIKNVILESIRANKVYLQEIASYYKEKGELPISYKLARKNAFLETGNLNSAFQRMTQEPKNRQQQIDIIYNVVSLNQTFLGALASLGTYIRNHETTAASGNFEIIVEHIVQNLDNSEKSLEKMKFAESPDKNITDRAGKEMEKAFERLLEKRNEKPSGKLQNKIREYHLVINQLKWLLEISEKLQKNISQTNFS